MCILLFKPMVVLKSPTGLERKCGSAWLESTGIPTGACAVVAENKIFVFKNFYPILAVLKIRLGQARPLGWHTQGVALRLGEGSVSREEKPRQLIQMKLQ